MVRFAIVFLVVALIAACIGLEGVAGYSWKGAKILWEGTQILLVICLVLVMVSFLGHRFGRRTFGK